jgi:hypothetical protein
MLHPVTFLSVSIARPADAVYAFVADPTNVPRWAEGLAGAVRRVGDDWIAESPMGTIKLRFADPNPHGVLDHAVTLPDGTVVLNPMRVVPNGDGAEVTFTLFRQPGVTDDAFAADAAQVRKDLNRLKAVLEG